MFVSEVYSANTFTFSHQICGHHDVLGRGNVKLVINLPPNMAAANLLRCNVVTCWGKKEKVLPRDCQEIR
jgi:hypothetical protein